MKSKILAAIAAVAMLCACFAISAANIPSSATGTYVGTGATAGWTCQAQFFQIAANGATNRVQDVDCQVPGDRKSGATSAADACVSETTASPLVPWSQLVGPWVTPSTPRFSVLAYSLSTAGCPAGAQFGQMDVLISGVVSKFCRTQAFLPATPYAGCVAAAEPVARKEKR